MRDHASAGCGAPTTRRGFLATAFAMTAIPTARAGQPIVAYLGIATEESDRSYLAGLRQGLAELGHRGTGQIVLEQRFARGDIAQYNAIIDDAANRGAAVIVVPGIAAALAVRERAPRIPVVAVGLPSTAIFPQLFTSLDRIVKGEDPAAMPIQLATEFDLVVNADTAETLSLTVPNSILIRADEVIG